MHFNRGLAQRFLWHRMAVALVLLLAAVVRFDRAVREPVVNPDVIRFINQGKLLGSRPIQALQTEVYHPLHSLLGLIVHDVLTRHLCQDDRLAWIAAMKLVGGFCAVVVTYLIIRLSRHVGAPGWAACGAGLLWAVGRRSSGYGADGMSDMLFLAFFGASLLAGMRTRLHWRAGGWFTAGVLAGLSYLARPEGVAAVLILGAALGLYYLGLHPRWPGMPVRQGRFHRAAFPWSHAVTSSAVLLLGFMLCALPYMSIIGRFTGKKPLIGPDPNVMQALLAAPEPIVSAAPQAAGLAVGVLAEGRTWRLLAMELWETFGFAPCLVVAGAMLLKPRLWGWPHWRGLVMVWLGVWFALMIWLINKAGYLDGRHTLALQLVLHCLFALALPIWERPMRWWQGWWRTGFKSGAYWSRLPRWMRWGGWPKVMGPGAILLGCLPGVVMLREPPSRDRAFIRQAAAWVEQHTPDNAVIADVTGQLAFYSGRDHQLWLGQPENPRIEVAEACSQSRPVILAYVYQTDKGTPPASAIAGWQRVGPLFPAIGSRHADVLALYAKPGSGAVK